MKYLKVLVALMSLELVAAAPADRRKASAPEPHAKDPSHGQDKYMAQNWNNGMGSAYHSRVFWEDPRAYSKTKSDRKEKKVWTKMACDAVAKEKCGYGIVKGEARTSQRDPRLHLTMEDATGAKVFHVYPPTELAPLRYRVFPGLHRLPTSPPPAERPGPLSKSSRRPAKKRPVEYWGSPDDYYSGRPTTSSRSKKRPVEDSESESSDDYYWRRPSKASTRSKKRPFDDSESFEDYYSGRPSKSSTRSKKRPVQDSESESSDDYNWRRPSKASTRPKKRPFGDSDSFEDYYSGGPSKASTRPKKRPIVVESSESPDDYSHWSRPVKSFTRTEHSKRPVESSESPDHYDWSHHVKSSTRPMYSKHPSDSREGPEDNYSSRVTKSSSRPEHWTHPAESPESLEGYYYPRPLLPSESPRRPSENSSFPPGSRTAGDDAQTDGGNTGGKVTSSVSRLVPYRA